MTNFGKKVATFQTIKLQKNNQATISNTTFDMFVTYLNKHFCKIYPIKSVSCE